MTYSNKNIHTHFINYSKSNLSGHASIFLNGFGSVHFIFKTTPNHEVSELLITTSDKQITEEVENTLLEFAEDHTQNEAYGFNLDTGYDYEINEEDDSKSGFFYFEENWEEYKIIKVGFSSDQYGNIESLEVLEALDQDENPVEFNLTKSLGLRARDQIEPMLWEEEA